MICTIVRNGFLALRRDRGALILAFVLPIAFFTIFGIVFGGMRTTGTPRVSLLVVDEDRSPVSERVVRGLQHDPSLLVSTPPEAKPGAGKDAPVPPDYTAATAETAVKQGEAPVALIIPNGFGASPIAFDPATDRKVISLLQDSSDPIAAQVVAGMLQKVVMTSLPDTMAEVGMKYLDQASGGLTAQQRKSIESDISRFREQL